MWRIVSQYLNLVRVYIVLIVADSAYPQETQTRYTYMLYFCSGLAWNWIETLWYDSICVWMCADDDFETKRTVSQFQPIQFQSKPFCLIVLRSVVSVVLWYCLECSVSAPFYRSILMRCKQIVTFSMGDLCIGRWTCTYISTAFHWSYIYLYMCISVSVK